MKQNKQDGNSLFKTGIKDIFYGCDR